MTDHSADAEEMFRAVAARQGLEIGRDPLWPDEFIFELVSDIEDDPMVTLGLQNGDELSFEVHDFSSSFFPFAEMKTLFEKTVEGWFTGQTRLVYRWRGRRLIKIELQVKLKGGKWQRVYTHLRSMIFPLWTTRDRVQYRPNQP